MARTIPRVRNIWFGLRMKTINIVVTGSRGNQWRYWIGALAGAGYQINIVDLFLIESKSIAIERGDIILLDGMIPNLSRSISHLCILYPETQVVVASVAKSFSIHYEVLQSEGAIYISGPMPPEKFVESIKGINSPPLAEAIPA